MSGGAVARGPALRRRRLLAVALVAAVALAAASIEPARRALSGAEPYVPLLLLALGTALAVAARLRRPARRGVRRGAARLCRHLARHGLALTVLAFLLPVWAAWELRPPAPLSAYAALFGRIPWSDAANYHAGALRLLDRGTLDDFNQRRPVNVALLAVRLAGVDGDLGAATVLQAAGVGVAAWLAAAAVAARFGVPSALAFLAVVLGLARPALATALSEPLGLALGCLGLALLLRGTTRGAPAWVLAAGLFGLTLAQEARPGALLVLPLLVAAAVAVSAARWRTLAALAAAVLLAAAVPAAVLRVHGSTGARPHSNFASIALALASGEGDWKAVLDAREVRLAGLDESAAARMLYAEAWGHVRREPQRLLAGLLRGTLSYLRALPRHLLESMTVPPLRWAAGVLLGAAAATAVASLAGGRAGPVWPWAAAAVGTLLSAPIVHEAGGMRVFAATDAFLAGFLALGVARRRAPALGPVAARWRAPLADSRAGTALLALVAAAALFGPSVARGATRRSAAVPTPVEGTLVRGRPIAVVVAPPSLVPPCAGVRVVSRRAFRQGVDLIGPDEANRLGRRRPPFAFALAYDPAAGVDRHLVGPAELACVDAAFLRVRTRPFLDSRLIEEVESYEVLSSPEPVRRSGP